MFEALYAGRLDYDEAARTVLWLEGHGFDGIELLVQALPALETHGLPAVQLSVDEPQRVVIQAGGASLFAIAGTVFDLAIAKACAADVCHLSVVDCTQAIVTLPGLARCGRHDLAAAAWWMDEATGPLHLGRIEAGQSLPAYYVNTTVPLPSTRAAELMCARDPEMLTKRFAGPVDASDPETSLSVSAAAMQEFFQRSLDEGMELHESDYRALGRIADRILVEASETSRLGAGEQTSGNTRI